jgi:hypothetical protein
VLAEAFFDALAGVEVAAILAVDEEVHEAALRGDLAHIHKHSAHEFVGDEGV